MTKDIIEISEGRGIDENKIYGVTIARFNIEEKKFNTQLQEFNGFNSCCNSYTEALIKVDAIKKRIDDVQ